MNTINRCLNANDEICKFPECKCAEVGLVGLPVIDMKFLEEESTNSRLRNSCMNDRLRDLPIQFADEDEGIGQFLDGIERNAKRFKNIAIAVLAGLLIGAVIYAATK